MKLIKTSFYSAIITIIRTVTGFVSSKFVAMYIGPAGLALVGQFINFITVTLAFANGGISNGIVKYTAEYEDDVEKQKSLLSSALRISLSCAVVVSILVISLAKYFSQLIFNTPNYKGPIVAFGIGILLFVLNTFLVCVLNGKKQIKKFTIVNITGTLLALSFTLILVYFEQVQGALYALALSQSVVVIVTVFLVAKEPWFSKEFLFRKFDLGLTYKLGSYALMAIISAATVPVAQMIIRHIVAGKLGIDQAGYWQAMMRVSDAYLMVVTTALTTYYLPQLSSLKNDLDIKKEIWQGYKIILPVTMLSCILIYFLRFVIIHVLYTKEFLPVEQLFGFQLVGDFFKIASWILGYLMIAKAMTKIYIASEILFSILYILLSYLCTHFFGLKGTVIAFAINYFIYFICMVLLFGKILFSKKN